MSQGLLLTRRHKIRTYRAVPFSNTSRKHRGQRETCQSAKKSDLGRQLPNFGKQFSGKRLAETLPRSQRF